MLPLQGTFVHVRGSNWVNNLLNRFTQVGKNPECPGSLALIECGHAWMIQRLLKNRKAYFEGDLYGQIFMFYEDDTTGKVSVSLGMLSLPGCQSPP